MGLVHLERQKPQAGTGDMYQFRDRFRQPEDPKEALTEGQLEFAYGKEYHALCALQELVRTNSFSTLQEDVVLDAVACAMEQLEEMRNE